MNLLCGKEKQKEKLQWYYMKPSSREQTGHLIICRHGWRCQMMSLTDLWLSVKTLITLRLARSDSVSVALVVSAATVILQPPHKRSTIQNRQIFFTVRCQQVSVGFHI